MQHWKQLILFLTMQTCISTWPTVMGSGWDFNKICISIFRNIFGLVRVSLLKGRELTSLPLKLLTSQGLFIMATLECSTTGSWWPKPNQDFLWMELENGDWLLHFHRWGKTDQAVLSYKAALRINPNLRSAQENLKKLSWKQELLKFSTKRPRKGLNNEPWNLGAYARLPQF